MPARDQQQEVRKGQLWIGEPRRKRVPFQMIDCNQRLVAGHRQRFGGHQPDHHAANQARTSGGGDGIHIAQFQPGISQRCCDQRRQSLNMRARGNLGNHPAIRAVRVVLRGNMLGQDRAATVNQCGGGFVARRFNSEHNRHPAFH